MLGMLKESDGKWSFSRVAATVIILCNIVWSSIALHKGNSIDIPVQWAGLAILIYTGNKVMSKIGK